MAAHDTARTPLLAHARSSRAQREMDVMDGTSPEDVAAAQLESLKGQLAKQHRRIRELEPLADAAAEADKLRGEVGPPSRLRRAALLRVRAARRFARLRRPVRCRWRT
jgi:hypothetical protein